MAGIFLVELPTHTLRDIFLKSNFKYKENYQGNMVGGKKTADEAGQSILCKM